MATYLFKERRLSYSRLAFIYCLGKRMNIDSCPRLEKMIHYKNLALFISKYFVGLLFESSCKDGASHYDIYKCT